MHLDPVHQAAKVLTERYVRIAREGGLNLDLAARLIGVRYETLYRWNKGQVVPNQRHRDRMRKCADVISLAITDRILPPPAKTEDERLAKVKALLPTIFKK